MDKLELARLIILLKVFGGIYAIMLLIYCVERIFPKRVDRVVNYMDRSDG